MSFIENLANRQKNTVLRPDAERIPLSLPEAMSGLAGSFRDPGRVNKAMNQEFVSTPRNTVQDSFYNQYRR